MAEQSPTEAILDATRDIDQWTVERIVQAIHSEDGRAWEAVGAVLPRVVEAAEVLVVALGGGGRWFNVGAGTSGRIGALDAAEIPPTFGVPHHRVQAVVAGGDAALLRAVEGAEDHPERAAFALRERGLRAGDVVVAISASGRTPFTLGSLDAAHEVGARTVGITCNPGSPLAEAAEIAIVPVVGPEVIAGSTRMKGGLAQKMVLNLLSTTVMVRLGYVSGNLMTHLVPASEKLRERGLRIVMAVGGLDRDAAAKLLAECDGSVAEATQRLRGSGATRR
jgi:N-acetylmuramic acid 6-phosphate etherase